MSPPDFLLDTLFGAHQPLPTMTQPSVAPTPVSPAARRRKLIADLEAKRGGRMCIAYITSTRPGHEIQIADDVLRLVYDHLQAGVSELNGKGVDLFLHSNGGSGTVPWRLVSLIREYTDDFAVLVPHSAFSAATLIALGANDIVMHRMGCLGPIDPSVANIFNPTNPMAPGQLAPISVEDVTAYFKLIREELGITHEDELIQAVSALTQQVHPLALGNVQRSHNQARMMARKLLRRHMHADAQESEIVRIIDTLKSNLFYHGHPINRHEAKNDLELKVSVPTPEIEQAMWNLYREYEDALNMREQLNPLHELKLGAGNAASVTPPTVAQVVQQMGQLAQNGINLSNVTPQQWVELAAALIPIVSGVRPNAAKVELNLPGAYVESKALSNVFKTELTLERASVATPSGLQEVVKQEVVWQRWEKEA